MLGFGKKGRSVDELKKEILQLQNELEAIEGPREEVKQAETAAPKKGGAELSSDFSELLFATLSHELRTPLNGVLGLAQLMRDELGDNEQLETLEGSARHMQAVLHTLVNFSKIQNNWGNLPEHKEWLNVHDMLEQFSKNLKARAGARHLKILVDHEDKRLTLRCDFDHLANIVETAILGSLEASQPPEDETIETMTVRWRKVDNAVQVTIINPLEVMPKDRGARVADVSSMVRGAHHGTIRMEFLYWAVATSLLEHYAGGMIANTFAEGQGVETILSFTMESMKASDSQAKPVGGLAISSGKKESATIEKLPFSKRVLLVEDDPVSRNIMKFLLQRLGQETVTASNGEEALAVLEKDHDFAMIFMDIDMPVLDGLSATRAIRMGEPGEECMNIPIAAVTAFNTLSDHSKFKKAGMNFTMSKPVSMVELRRILLEVVLREQRELGKTRPPFM